MAQWPLDRLASRIHERYVGVTLHFEQLPDFLIQVKKILVAQRENPIVNRLNKTKVEKFPDLAMEREEKLKALRKKDQAAKLERVSCIKL